MRLVLSLILTICFAELSSAAIVFSLVQDPSKPGPITLGNTAIFSVQISSDSGTINNLAGIDFVIQAEDPTFTGNATSGGQFISGTNDFFGPNGGFALGFPTSFQVFGANAGIGLTITSTPQTIATLTLSTVGATPGTYTMDLSGLVAVDPLFNSLPIVEETPLLYTIAAVPEPGSLALICVATTLFGLRRRKSNAV